MKKTVYITIISIITVFCIIIGCSIHVWGSSSFFGSVGTVSEDVELSEFDKIDMDLSVCSLRLEAGKEFGISYECSEPLVPKYKVEGDRLIVTQKDWEWFHVGTKKCSMVITVPKDAELSYISVKSNVGDIDICEINSQRFEAEADVGDIDIIHCSFTENMDVEADVGEVDVEATEFGNLSISADVGNVVLNGIDSSIQNASWDDYDVDIVTNLGSVSINGEKVKGEYHKNGRGGKKIKIEADCGDVDISWDRIEGEI